MTQATSWLSDAPWLLPAAGFIIGAVAGAASRWNHFCTLGSLERYFYANDSHGIKTWVFAAVVALLSTQLLISLQWINIDESFYLGSRLSLAGLVAGGLLFGIGMALVGTCGFGALVRLGSGSLDSLVVVVVMGLTAFSTQHGLLAGSRVTLFEPLTIELHSTSQSIPSLISALTGLSLQLPIALIISAVLAFWIFNTAAFRANHRSIITGAIIGLCVTAGWVITCVFKAVMYRQVQIESASFVLPPGELVFGFTASTGAIPDYGMGMVLGVIFGASAVALWNKEIRWEACDDARELGRHLTGAVLMGFGGVLALGCTIGQGVSAFSTMAVSAPIVFLCICLGAKAGLKVLVEGRTFWKP